MVNAMVNSELAMVNFVNQSFSKNHNNYTYETFDLFIGNFHTDRFRR